MTFDDHFSALIETAVSRALAEWTPPTTPESSHSDGPRLLTVGQAAEFLSVSEASVRRLLEKGNLPAVRCFSALRVDARDLDRWIDRAKGDKR